MGAWRLIVCGVVVFAALLDSGPARASGPVEQVVQVVFHPRDPDVIVLRFVNKGGGLFYSDDRGQTWRMACGGFLAAQFGASGDAEARNFDVTSFTVAGDGTMLASSLSYVWQGDARGCEWRNQPEYDGAWFTDFAPHPSDPDVLFAASGASGRRNGVVQRGADGTFTQFGPEADVQVFRLRVAATESGLRVYQTAISGTVPIEDDGGVYEAQRYVTRVSDDGAETFEEFQFGDGTASPRLLAVDPTNPDRIVAVNDRSGEPDDVLVSGDRGETFTTYLTVVNFRGLTITPDGRLMIAEGPETIGAGGAGLWFASSLDEAPTRIVDREAFCVGHQEATDTFYACLDKQFGRVDPEDGAFVQLFDFKTVQGFVECGGVDVAAACRMQLCNAYCGMAHFASAPVCAAYEGPSCGPCAAIEEERPAECAAGPNAGAGGTAAIDAGVNDGPDAGANDTPAADEDCACSTPGTPNGRGGARIALALVLALALATRRRTRAHAPAGAIG